MHAGWLTVALAVLVGCTSRRTEETQCTFNSECADKLVCAGGFCRSQCATDRDCTSGARCVPSTVASQQVCVSPTSQPLCTYPSDCPGTLVCTVNRLCGPQCQANVDCTVASFNPAATCVRGQCVLPGFMTTMSDAGTDSSFDVANDTAPDVMDGSFPQVTQLSGGQESGGTHACAVISDGSVKCWGDNSFGQLSNGTPPSAASLASLLQW